MQHNYFFLFVRLSRWLRKPSGTLAEKGVFIIPGLLWDAMEYTSIL